MSSNSGKPIILNSSHVQDLKDAIWPVIVRWSDIGSSLRVSQASLQEVRHDLHLINDSQRLEEMLILWIGSGKATIHALLKALRSRIIHRADIANEICARRGEQRTELGLCTTRCEVCFPDGPDVPLTASITNPKLSLKTLLQKEGLTENELYKRLEADDLLDLAGLFDNVELYVDKFQLLPGDKMDVRAKTMISGHLLAMHHALERWKGCNPYFATFKELLLIVLSMGKREIAVNICDYYKRKYKQAATPSPTNPPLMDEALLENVDWHPTDSVPLDPPVITEEPESIAVVSRAENVIISIKAQGRDLRYQWRRQTSLEKTATVVHNCGGYENVNTPSLRIRTAYASLAGYYSCKVTNPVGSVVSETAHLSIGVRIEESPKDQQVEEGSVVRMSIRATGTELVYQWYRDSMLLSNDRVYKGANTSTLSIVGANFAAVGSYVCKVSNHINEKETEPAHLEIVSRLPRIIRHPQNVTVNRHKDVTLSITAQGDHLHYQWRKHYSQADRGEAFLEGDEGEALLEGEGYRGVTTRQLVVESASVEEGGLYSCRVSNMRGTVWSNKARLHIQTRQEKRSCTFMYFAMLVGLTAILGGLWWYNNHTGGTVTSIISGGPLGTDRSSHQSIPSINSDHRPDYTKLRNYPLPDDIFIDIAQKIAGMGYDKFATLLLEDSDGTKVTVIKEGKRDTVQIVADVLKKWLQSSGKATWKLLVRTLRESELNTLADQISSSFV